MGNLETVEERSDDLVITIRHVGSVPAADIGRMLISLDKSFVGFLRIASPGQVRARLGVREVRRGSIELVLEAVGSASKLLGAAKYIAPFGSHLIEIAKSLLDLSGVPVKVGTKIDQKAVADMVAPAASGSAISVSITINGNATFHITNEMAKEIVNSAKSQSKHLLQSEATNALPMLSNEQAIRLTADGLIGTAFEVDQQWYARLEGGHGVLVPVSGPGADGLMHGGLYHFKGRAERGSRGETVGMYLSQSNRYRTG